MARATKKLDDLARLLEKTGGDPQRLEAVKRAQRFRRSWIDLAQMLCKIRSKRSYQRWGYEDFHTYCSEELTLKKATVDKLTISYSTLERHAPAVLDRDGIAKTIPSYEAIDYYSKVVDTPANDAGDDEDDEAPRPRRASKLPPPRVTDEVVSELRTAVFDEGQPVAELRKRFDPIIFPQPKNAEKLAVIQRASAAARKLAELLPDIEGLPESQVSRLESQLGKLRTDLEQLAEPLKEKVARAQKRARKRGRAPQVDSAAVSR